MSVTAIGKYEFEPLDKQENFHGNIITYWHWEKHLAFCSAVAIPFPPDMRFGDVVEKVFPDVYGAHPEFDKIDWSGVDWALNQKPFIPDFDKSLEENGFDHKSVVRFWTPGLDGYKGNFELMSHQLTIEPIGETIEVEEGQTILDAALRRGIYMPYQCNHGLCSTCKVDVVDGVVDHGDASMFALMDFERDEGKTLACCATLETDATIEADIEEEEDALYLPVEDYEGTVTELVDLTGDIKGLHIEVNGDGLEFQAGQYINLDLPGLEEPRAFSLANSPNDANRVELHVRLVEGGLGTTHIHKKMKVGDKVTFTGPFGRFFVRKSFDKPMIFIAGGSGLSSPKSMVLDLLEEDCDLPITLFHGVRTAKDVYCDDLFRALEEKHSNFTYVPALSEGADDDGWDGERGFINEVAERHFDGRFSGSQAYLCGPPPMIEASIRTLMKGRLFEKDIYTEKFVTQADGEAALARSPLFKRI